MTKLHRAPTFVLAVVVGLGCAACSSGHASSPAAAASPASPGTASTRLASSSGDVPPPPKVGQCRNTPPRHLGFNDWVDPTPVVDCSKEHTLETIEVVKPTAVKLTLSLVKQLTGSCNTPAAGYYLGDPTTLALTRLLYPAAYWPTPEQRAAGQSWVRCDIGVQATTRCCRPRAQLAPQTASLRGVVGADLGRFRLCIGELPAPARNQRLASCQRPHRSEALPTSLQINVTQYPSAAVLARKGRSGCADLVKDRADASTLVLTPFWTPRSDWSSGTLYGTCWINRKTGMLPPLG